MAAGPTAMSRSPPSDVISASTIGGTAESACIPDLSADFSWEVGEEWEDFEWPSLLPVGGHGGELILTRAFRSLSL
jgi:hypothetical protein